MKSDIIFKIAINLVGIALMCLIAVGFKTKLTSVILVLWLFGLNMSMHNFWAHSPKERQGKSSNFRLLGGWLSDKHWAPKVSGELCKLGKT